VPQEEIDLATTAIKKGDQKGVWIEIRRKAKFTLRGGAGGKQYPESRINRSVI